MTDPQWQILCDAVAGREAKTAPVGFIIDSPWLPGWAGAPLLDYFASEDVWFEANVKAIEAFPDVIFLPGFWAEYGMCTEPSAFGCKCSWQENELPFAARVLADADEAARLEQPNPATDGLLPFVLSRLRRCRRRIEKNGHSIRFAVTRGPLNIASFLMGTTEFLTAIKTEPDAMQKLLDTITGFAEQWLRLQKQSFDTVDGVFILDDVLGFLGPEDFKVFAYPFLKRCFEAIDAKVRFFHNDARGDVCAPMLGEMGINLFNFSSTHGLGEMRELAGEGVALLGGIPPRDVLAAGTAEQVREAVGQSIQSIGNLRGVILSCGGGMPPGVASENIRAFVRAAASANR